MNACRVCVCFTHVPVQNKMHALAQTRGNRACGCHQHAPHLTKLCKILTSFKQSTRAWGSIMSKMATCKWAEATPACQTNDTPDAVHPGMCAGKQKVFEIHTTTQGCSGACASSMQQATVPGTHETHLLHGNLGASLFVCCCIYLRILSTPYQMVKLQAHAEMAVGTVGMGHMLPCMMLFCREQNVHAYLVIFERSLLAVVR